MKMYLYCLACGKKYSICLRAMRHMTYREYSYCDKCHIDKEGKPRRWWARLATRKGAPNE